MNFPQFFLTYDENFPWWLSGKEPACQCRRHRQCPSLGQEDSLEKEMVTLSSILAWEIPRTDELGGSMRSERVGHYLATNTTMRHCCVTDTSKRQEIVQYHKYCGL